MGMLHYPKPYFGFGIDLFNTQPEDTWAVNYMNGIYQFVKKGHVLQFDGKKAVGLYALSDSLMKNNLLNNTSKSPLPTGERLIMERELKAIIQQYMERMINNQLTP